MLIYIYLPKNMVNIISFPMCLPASNEHRPGQIGGLEDCLPKLRILVCLQCLGPLLCSMTCGRFGAAIDL